MKSLTVDLCTFMNIETQSVNYIPNYPVKLYFHESTKFDNDMFVRCLLHHATSTYFYWIKLNY